LTDILTGLYAGIGILSALTNRDRTGHGQHIDLSLLDVSVACMANQAMNYLATGDSPERMGNAHPNIVPYQAFPAADGHLIITAGNNRQFSQMCAALDVPELAKDERYQSNELRVKHRDSLIPVLQQQTSKKTVSHWLEVLTESSVPCGPINTMHDVFADPHVTARGMKIDQPVADADNIPGVGSPIRLSDTPVTYRTAPPQLGADTLAILQRELAMSADECQQLIERGICHSSH